MLNITPKSQFKKDLKRCKKRGKDTSKIKALIDLLAEKQKLPSKYRDHTLTGNYVNHREFHIEPDWLLIYQIIDQNLILARTGSHADLFSK
jgi:mRNA interferase YafQ